MSISWNTSSGAQYNLSGNGNWKKQNSASNVPGILNRKFDSLLNLPGTLQLGDTSIEINGKEDLPNHFTEIKKALETLENNQQASIGPTQALRKDLKNIVDAEISNKQKAKKANENIVDTQKGLALYYQANINDQKQDLSFLQRHIFKPELLRTAEKAAKEAEQLRAEAQQKVTELNAEIQNLETQKELIAPKQASAPQGNQVSVAPAEQNIKKTSLPSYLQNKLVHGNASNPAANAPAASAAQPVASEPKEAQNTQEAGQSSWVKGQKPSIDPNSPIRAGVQKASNLHPHIKDTDIAWAVRKALQPSHTEDPADINIKALNEKILEEWKQAGIIDKDSNIDFTKLDLSKLGLSKSDIRKAHLKGKIWLKENGEFDMKVSGNIGDTSATVLKALKDKVNAEFAPPGDNRPISIDPEAVRKLSPEDEAALSHGGQVQFLSTGDGKMLKLTLDPGEDGKGDGLTIRIFGDEQKNAIKVPLAVVFEGADLNGFSAKKDGHPFLEDWRKQDLFNKAIMQEEVDRLIPFTSRFDRITNSNEEDIGRVQAENTLWNAVHVYLGMVGETLPERDSKITNAIEESFNAEDLDKVTKDEPLKAQRIPQAVKGKLPEPFDKNPLLNAIKRLDEALSKLPHPEANPISFPESTSSTAIPINSETERISKGNSIEAAQASLKDSPLPEASDNVLGALKDISASLQELIQTQTTRPTSNIALPPNEESNILDAVKAVNDAAKQILSSPDSNASTSIPKQNLVDAAQTLVANINALTNVLRAEEAQIHPTPNPNPVPPVNAPRNPLEQETANVRANLRHIEPNAGRTPPVDGLTQTLRNSPALERAIRLQEANSKNADNNSENFVDDGSSASPDEWNE